MPASMMIACVALSPKVTGSRIEMPASGPMPGSTPTRVPTRQPRNAYQRLDGSNATEKPCNRLMTVSSTWVLKSERAGVEWGLQHVHERDVGQRDYAHAIEDGIKRVAAFDNTEQRPHQQHHRDEKSEPLEQSDAGSRDPDHKRGVPGVAPGNRGEGRAFGPPQDQ